MKKIVSLLALWVLAAAAVQAKVELPPVLSDNMVLQQKQEVALWGKATGKKVTITATCAHRIYGEELWIQERMAFLEKYL